MSLVVQSSIPFVLLLLFLLTGLAFTVLIDPYIRRDHRKTMLLIVVLLFTLVVQNYLGFLLDLDGTRPFLRTLAGIYGYSMRPMVLVLLFNLVAPQRTHRAVWVLIAINCLVHLTALFSGICFSIDGANQFHRGPLGYCCHAVSAILLVWLLYLTLRTYGWSNKLESWIPVWNAAVIILSVLLDSQVDYRTYPITFLTIAMVSSTVFYYIWLHLQFVREHEQALQAEQRIQIMMTQIQPHFLFNTIATFKALCRKDPDRAAEVADKFGTYLRQNLDSLGMTECIPLDKELEHTKVYSDIEMVRFDTIRVEYTIQDHDVLLPPLTIQPLVENAIRHGVRICEEGIVQVIARRQADCHEIIIRDNGKGFDPEKIGGSDREHIGIRNVRERIERMCGGTLTIDSRIGEGTIVTIRIPLDGSGDRKPGEEA